MTLEWVMGDYKPWWKALLALLLLSIKPQTPYLVIIVILIGLLRNSCRSDLARIGLSSSPLVAFLVYRNDLISDWIVSFNYSGRWATSSLPSWLYNYFALTTPVLLAVPSGVIALSAIVFFREKVTPYQLLWCFVVSSLTAPYAWIFDYVPLVIVVYAVMATLVGESTLSLRRIASLCVLTALCTPFEGLFTIDLNAYILHPLLVAAVLFVNRRRVCEFVTKAVDRKIEQPLGVPE